MGGSGKGGQTTTETRVRLDPRIEQGGAEALGAAFRSASLPFVPNRGVTLAGFSPQQLAAFQGANEAASAFGLPSVSNAFDYLPTPQQNSEGIYGYSPSASYDFNLNASMSPNDVAMRNALLDSYARAGNNTVPDPAFMHARENGICLLYTSPSPRDPD